MDRSDKLQAIFINSDIKHIAYFMRELLSCKECPAKKLCDECIEESYNGDCECVLASWLAYDEESDTQAQRERERAEAEAEDRAAWEGWRDR